MPSILLVCREQDLLFYEQLVIDALRPAYNCSKIAGKVDMTPEVRAKIREKAVGQQRRLGAKLSDETRRLIADKAKGRVVSAETRAKIGARAREMHVRRRALGLKRKGWIPSPETRAKLSEAGKRQLPPTAQTRAKMSEAQRRRPPVGPETREKHRQLALSNKLWTHRSAYRAIVDADT